MHIESKSAILALDVGGTTVEGAPVTEQAKEIGEIQRIDSPSQERIDIIVAQFAELLNRMSHTAKHHGYTVVAASIGMPNPFDYDSGVSLMKHKFRGLYRKNLKKPLEANSRVPVFFINDADAFGLGVSYIEYPGERRLLAITLGTGLGSSFIIEGRLGTSGEDVPPDGEIWNVPFKDGILEDRISGRAIEQSYRIIASKICGDAKSAVERITAHAREGDTAAKEAFQEFATNLGEGLAIACDDFGPTRIVFGGQISKAFDLFGETARRIYEEKAASSVVFSKAENQHLALYGAARYAFDRLRGQSLARD